MVFALILCCPASATPLPPRRLSFTSMAATKSDEEDAGESASAALFQNVDDISLADGFKDKVAALHEHFDRDRDGFLNHSELRGLQLLTRYVASVGDLTNYRLVIGYPHACMFSLIHSPVVMICPRRNI